MITNYKKWVKISNTYLAKSAIDSFTYCSENEELNIITRDAESFYFNNIKDCDFKNFLTAMKIEEIENETSVIKNRDAGLLRRVLVVPTRSV